MKAILLTIGDEILAGNTVDTNSAYIAGKLREIGIGVSEIRSVSDAEDEIVRSLQETLALADLIVMTGGLGPTNDDKTKAALCKCFADKLTFDELTFNHLKDYFIRRGRENLLELNREQAMVLSRARVFQNEYGSAPCQMLEEKGKLIFSLPGVPFEVKPLLKDKIIPFLQARFSLPHIMSRTVSVVSFPESQLSATLQTWEKSLPEAVSLSYLPVGNRVKLRLTVEGSDKAMLQEILAAEVAKLQPLIGDHVIAWNADDVAEMLKELLLDKKLTISTAESCTAGEVARLITSVPGLSAFYLGGVIPYEIDKKVKLLGVSEKTLTENTVVSAEVAGEMAQGCQKLFQTDIALSTTGVAGPDPDEFNNEVGTVFYTLRVRNFEKTQKLFLPHLERNDFAAHVAQRVLQDLVEILVTENF